MTEVGDEAEVGELDQISIVVHQDTQDLLHPGAVTLQIIVVHLHDETSTPTSQEVEEVDTRMTEDAARHLQGTHRRRPDLAP